MTVKTLMVDIIKYEDSHKSLWNEFVANSKNGTFLFNRNYMEYHSDRFQDFSLLIYNDNKLIGLFPANVSGSTVVSHAGLTYGGVISNSKMMTPLMLEIFAALKHFLHSSGIKKLRYKAIPHIYHSFPAEEDLYALFVNGAKLVRRDVSTSIFSADKPPLSKGAKYGISRGLKNDIEIRQSYDFEAFIDMENVNLQRKYGVTAVHSGQELRMLAERFPENIKLFCAYKNDKLLAGMVIYETQNVAHAQYMASNDEGKEANAIYVVTNYIINELYKDKKVFDFGISTEQEGRYLNESLIAHKERFGGRATVYDTYELDIS